LAWEEKRWWRIAPSRPIPWGERLVAVEEASMALPGGSEIGAFILRNGGVCCTNGYRLHQLYGGFGFGLNALAGSAAIEAHHWSDTFSL